MRGLTVVLGVSWWTFVACVSAASETLIGDVHVVKAQEGHCVTVAGDQCPEGVRAAVELWRGTSRNIPTWLHESFSGDPAMGYKETPLDEKHRALSSISHDYEGFVFSGGSWRLRYWEADCRIFHCVKPFLARSDQSGRGAWRRRVPFLETPVYPLVVGDHLLYIGFDGSGTVLVVIDLRNGRVVTKHRIPQEAGEFSLLNPVATFPALVGDKLILQGYVVERPGPKSREPSRYLPQNVYVFDVSPKLVPK